MPCAKMLKKLKTKKRDFFVTFLSLVAFQLGGPGPPAPGYAYNCNFNATCDIKILCAFLLVCPSVHVKATLMVLFRMIMLNRWYYW